MEQYLKSAKLEKLDRVEKRRSSYQAYNQYESPVGKGTTYETPLYLLVQDFHDKFFSARIKQVT